MALLCRVSLALALTALLPAAAEPWIDYSSNGQATGVLHDTGYRMDVLEAVWCLDEIPRTSPDASQKLQRVHGGKKAGRLPVRGASWVCDVCRSELYPSVPNGGFVFSVQSLWPVQEVHVEDDVLLTGSYCYG